MKHKISFDVRKEVNEIVFRQVVEKRMPLIESVKELGNLKGELIQLEGKSKQMETTIKEKQLEKDLSNLLEQITGLKGAELQWNKIIEPLLEEIRKDLRRKVTREKAKRGYKRLTDMNQKIVMQNEIIAPLCTEFNLEMNSPVILKLKQDFDKL